MIDFGVLASSVNTSYFKYLSILLCTYYVFTITKHNVFRYCMLCLCLADYILLFTDYYSIGIIIFCMIQCTYMYILEHNHNIFYYALIYAIIIFILSFQSFPMLYIVSFIYASFSFYNISYALYIKEYSLVMTIILLAICDIFVALSYYFNTLSMYIWIFYLPSQLFFIQYCKRQEHKMKNRSDL